MYDEEAGADTPSDALFFRRRQIFCKAATNTASHLASARRPPATESDSPRQQGRAHPVELRLQITDAVGRKADAPLISAGMPPPQPKLPAVTTSTRARAGCAHACWLTFLPRVFENFGLPFACAKPAVKAKLMVPSLDRESSRIQSACSPASLPAARSLDESCGNLLRLLMRIADPLAAVRCGAGAQQNITPAY